MQPMILTSWSDFKALVASKKLLMQFTLGANTFEVFAPEAGAFMWQISLVYNTEDAQDFEANFKATANQPLEVKGDFGKPIRFSPSSQPLNTVEKWKGFHFEDEENATITFDLEFDDDVYLRGGFVYSDNADNKDYITAHIVLKSDPTVIVVPNILESVYMTKCMMIPFMSAENMNFPSTVMIRAVYHKKEGDTSRRDISAVVDYYQ